MSTTPEQHEELITALRKVLQTKHPYMLDILEEIRKTPNGLVSLQLRVYNGVVQDCLFTEIVRKTYKQNTQE